MLSTMIYCKSNNSRVYKLKRYHTYVQSTTRCTIGRVERRIDCPPITGWKRTLKKNFPSRSCLDPFYAINHGVEVCSTLRSKWRTIEADDRRSWITREDRFRLIFFFAPLSLFFSFFLFSSFFFLFINSRSIQRSDRLRLILINTSYTRNDYRSI